MEKIIGFIIKKKRLEQNMSQESLCKGICGISYLSKIESGSAKADIEIISQLFRALGIAFRDEVLDREEYEIYRVFDRLFVQDISHNELKEIQDKYSYLMYSPKVLTYELLNFVVRGIEGSNESDKTFLEYEMFLDRNQLYYFYMIVAMFYTYNKNDKNKSIFYFDKAFLVNPKGKGLYNIAITYYLSGDYNRAIEYFDKDFDLEIDLGNIDDAVSDCIYLASCYSNLNVLPLMEKYFKKAMSLTKNMDDNVKSNIYYNLGATYIGTTDVVGLKPL